MCEKVVYPPFLRGQRCEHSDKSGIHRVVDVHQPIRRFLFGDNVASIPTAKTPQTLILLSIRCINFYNIYLPGLEAQIYPMKEASPAVQLRQLLDNL
jgi:hypothetical protein